MKTTWHSIKCDLCGEDSTKGVAMEGLSMANGRRFKRHPFRVQKHICNECLTALNKGKCCCGKRR